MLGRDVLKTAAKNLVRGKVFDENFLMSLATLGAFAIGEFPEAVGVMLFYCVGEYLSIGRWSAAAAPLWRRWICGLKR